MIQLLEVSSAAAFDSPALRERMQRAPHSIVSRHLKAVNEEGEVALVVLDVWPPAESDEVLLYELFVRPDRRGRGIGTDILRTVEAHARQLGRRRVRLRPRPLDNTRTHGELLSWYVVRGYTPACEEAGVLEKVVGP